MSEAIRRTPRKDAIRILSRSRLNALTLSERKEQLWSMSNERWDSDPNWESLDPVVRQALSNDNEGEISDVESPRYDPALMLWLESTFEGASNGYLLNRLRELSVETEGIIGDGPILEPCPCCGLRTILRRGEYHICRVCWWEDDGQDNGTADVESGPNRLSLTRARANYLKTGISDPSRTDLRASQEPPDKYAVGRAFELSADGTRIDERDSGWQAILDG